MRPVIRVLWMIAGMAGLLGAQDFDLPVSSVPARAVHDEARLFAAAPERLEAMSERLEALHERTGFRVRVAFMHSLIGRTVFEESRRLREAWLQDEPGLVLVLEVDSGHWEIGWAERTMSAGNQELPAVGPSEVAPQEQVSIVNHLRTLPAPRLRSREDAEVLVDELIGSLEATVGAEQSPAGHRGRLLLLALGLGAGLLLIALLVAAGVRRADRRAADRWYFPEIEVGERLKAPRGGGMVSSRSFGASA